MKKKKDRQNPRTNGKSKAIEKESHKETYTYTLTKREKGGFPGGAVVENLSASAGDAGSSPGLGRSTCRGATRPVSHNC